MRKPHPSVQYIIASDLKEVSHAENEERDLPVPNEHLSGRHPPSPAKRDTG